MSFTLNEIETTSMKAARGAGLDWGIAEEAGKAVRWLAGRGLPGPELLAELLTHDDGKRYDDLAPLSTEDVWAAKSGCLSPLIAGVTLVDSAETLARIQGFELGKIAFPLLLAPYGSVCAKILGVSIELSWSGVALTVTPSEGCLIEGSGRDVLVSSVNSALCRVAENSDTESPIVAPARCAVDTEIWNRLNVFVHRTYAPATETSRVLGAGSELIDD